MKKSTAEDFFARAERKPNGCLIWGGAKFDNGYGAVSYQGKQWRAHRLAWTLAYGPIPPGLNICHACDTRACMEIGHLLMGSQKANIADAVAKGRMKGVPGARSASTRKKCSDAAHARWEDPVKRAAMLAGMNAPEIREARRQAALARWSDPEWSARTRAKMRGANKPARGTGNARAKLSEDDVRAIRDLVTAGETRRAIAARFGVSATNVSDIVGRRTWAHIS